MEEEKAEGDDDEDKAAKALEQRKKHVKIAMNAFSQVYCVRHCLRVV